MAYLARLGELVTDTARRVQETLVSAQETHTLTVHIVNSTSRSLKWVQAHPSSGSTCSSGSHFGEGRELPPGQAGAVLIAGPMPAFGGAVGMSLGEERLVVGGSFQAGIKYFRVELAGTTPAKDFVKNMPMGVMGGKGSQQRFSQAPGSGCVAFVLDVSDDFSEAQVVLTEADRVGDLEVLAEIIMLDGLQQLRLAEWCLSAPGHEEAARHALFLAEFAATERGMPGCRLEDQAYALDVLIFAFITSGVLADVKDALADSTRRLEELPHPPSTTSGYDAYLAWARGLGDARALEQRLLAGRSLLRAASLRSAAACSRAWGECRGAGTLGDKRTAKARELGNALDDVKAGPTTRQSSSMMPSSTEEAAASAEAALAAAVRRANDGFVLAEGALQVALAKRSKSTIKDTGSNIDPSTFIKELVGFCISTSTGFAKRRAAVYAAAARGCGSGARALAAFAEEAPTLRRAFEQDFKKADAGAELEVKFETFSAEVWGTDASASTDQVLVSLGRGAESLEGMTTNSMSGEFFFQSRDGRFFVKTISEPEGDLLRQMAPAYRAHMRRSPRSLINRYAGLFLVEAPGVPRKYFIVMRSVFDPGVIQKTDEVFDLKGSMVNRKKQEGQSVGKDEDWVLAGDDRRLRLAASARRELLATHALDLQFLLDFGVMDYSVLVSSHRYDDKQDAAPLQWWRQEGGLWSEEHDEIYFLGIIDHLVRYDLGRTWQNLKEGDDAEIVRPDKYASRQVAWFRDHIVQKVEPADDWGTAGRITVSELAGHGISRQGLVKTMMKAGGDLGLSVKDTALAPYVAVTLGLRSACTEVIENRPNPDWGAWPLHLNVDAADVAAADELQIQLEVRQRTLAPIWKGDDVLGVVRVPLRDVLQAAKVASKPLALKRMRLEDCTGSDLSVSLLFQPVPAPEPEPDAEVAEGALGDLVEKFGHDGPINPEDSQCGCLIA